MRILGLPFGMSNRTLLFSLTRKDFVIQHFCVSGNGGGGKDTSNTGVRILHPPSGAKGEGREYRSQEQNKRAAFKRLVETKEFKAWHKLECARRMNRIETPEEIRARVDRMVDQGIADGTILIEEFMA